MTGVRANETKAVLRSEDPSAAPTRVKKESGVKMIVLVHEQNYLPAEKFTRRGLLKEIKRAGLEGPIHSSIDADVY